MGLDTIRVFAIAKLGWIKQQQKKLQEQERETPREYLDRESNYAWGKRYLLKVIESDAAAPVRRELGDFDIERTEVIGGEVVVRRAMAELLEPAHA